MRRKIATRDSGEPFALAQQRARHRVISLASLTAVGASETRVRRWVGQGRLFPLHQGVYSLGPPPLTRHGDWLAAVLACGATAALSHLSAAQLWAFTSFLSGPFDVSVDTPGGRRRPGIRVHRTTHLPRVTEAHIPVTTPTRTLLDLAAVTDGTALRRAIEEADRLDRLYLKELAHAIEQRRGRRGNAALREVLADYTLPAPTRSTLEALFLDLIREYGLPLPKVNAIVAGLEVDMWWPEARVVVELDGAAFHSHDAAQARDLDREAILHRAGLTLRRFSWRQVSREPELVAEIVAGALGAQRQPRLQPRSLTSSG